MPVIVVGSEKTIAALKPRLFVGKVSTAAARGVTDSIKAANPGVDFDQLEPGTVINVPDSPHVSARSNLSLDEGTTGMLGGLADAGTAALADLATSTKARETTVAAERKSLAQSLTGKQVTAARRKDKALDTSLKAVTAAIAEDETRSKAASAAFKKAQDDWSKELAALKSLVQ